MRQPSRPRRSPWAAIWLVVSIVPGAWAAQVQPVDRDTLHLGDRVPPRDESTLDPTFAAFRTRLLDVVRHRDLAGLRPLLAPTVNVEFSNDYTPTQFIAWLRRKSDADRTSFWTMLQRAVELGTVRVSGAMCAPYVYADAPIGDPSHPWLVVTGKDVPVHAGPRETTKVLATLSDEIVREGDPTLIEPDLRSTAALDPIGAWVFVTTKTKVTGYVRGDRIWKTDGMRYCFDNTSGSWRLSAMASSVD